LISKSSSTSSPTTSGSLENTRPSRKNPRIYNDYINDGVYLLLTQSTLPREVNVSNAVARMALIPKIIAAARQNLRNRRPSTRTPPSGRTAAPSLFSNRKSLKQ